MKPVYFAANRAAGCGHGHRTVKAARGCLRSIDAYFGKPKVYKLLGRRPWRAVPV